MRSIPSPLASLLALSALIVRCSAEIFTGIPACGECKAGDCKYIKNLDPLFTFGKPQFQDGTTMKFPTKGDFMATTDQGTASQADDHERITLTLELEDSTNESIGCFIYGIREDKKDSQEQYAVVGNVEICSKVFKLQLKDATKLRVWKISKDKCPADLHYTGT